jgi:hypothetical protein
MMGVFTQWQPTYAARGIPTFPVRIDHGVKKPDVKNYLKLGPKVSQALAQRFTSHDALGFAVRRARISVLDVDAPDERVLVDALDRHGPTPIVVRTGSGNWQAYYRHNGERRHVRPWAGLPIDVLGDGYVVAPPSKGTRGDYAIVQGTLDDLDRATSATARARSSLAASRYGRMRATSEGSSIARCQRTVRLQERHVTSRGSSVPT